MPDNQPSPDSINPYEASQSLRPATAPVSSAKLDRPGFAARLVWSDRRAFLRSVLPARFAIIGGGLLWGKHLIDAFDPWGRAIIDYGGELFVAQNIAPALGAALIFVQALLALYLCWIGGEYVNRLQAVAGGKTCSLHRWSQMHLYTERLGAAATALAIASEVVVWLLSRTLQPNPLGGFG